jgi:hypothetical protein
MGALAERVLGPGEKLAHVGVLVACEPGAGPLRGLAVRVEGDALARGLVEVTRARARPWSARLAPWEQAGWEHALEPVGDGAVGGVLAGARVRSGDRAAQGRAGLAHAVWVEIEGCARAAGRGALQVQVTPAEGGGPGVRETVALRVREPGPGEVLSAYLAWPGPLDARGREVRDVLDGFARRVAALPRGERVVVARGTAPDRLYLRPGCVVLGARGLQGDARWRALAQRLSAGRLEHLVLAPPGGAPRRDEVLEAVVAHAARFAPGPVELALSVGRALVPEDALAALAGALAAMARQSGAARAVVAEHDWVPSVLCVPWVGEKGAEGAVSGGRAGGAETEAGGASGARWRVLVEVP